MPERCVRVQRKREQLVKQKRQEMTKVVIVTEGERTEYNYFNAISQTFLRERTGIRIETSGGNSAPGQVLDKAMKLRVEYPKATVFIVIDDDERARDELQNVLDKCNPLGEIKPTGINCILSNRSFEFWGLLHFQNNSRAYTRGKLYAEVAKYFKSFNPDRNKVLEFKYLGKTSREQWARIQPAIENAKSVRSQNGYHICSVTNVDQLLECMVQRLGLWPM